MRKLCLLLPLLFLLCACGETVRAPAPVSAPQPEPLLPPDLTYSVLIAVPPDAEEVFPGMGQTRRYRAEDGSYDILVDVFSAGDLDSAILRITGSEDPPDLIQSARFSLPEYRLSWRDGERVCRADVIRDGDRFYAVICTADPDRAAVAAEVFSTVGLYYDEGA